jgi:hypothetical protein
VTPVKYELGFYITEDGILHSHRRENLKSYTVIDFRGKCICFITEMNSGLHNSQEEARAAITINRSID